MTTGPGIDEVRAAAARIRGLVRKTPLVTAAPVREQSDVARGLLLKLESLQVTGSFKARGAINAVFALSPVALERGVVTASGGNHGLAVAYAGSPRRSSCRARSLLTSSRSLRAGAHESKCRAKCGMTATWRPYVMPKPKASPTSTRLPILRSSPAKVQSRSRSLRKHPISTP